MAKRVIFDCSTASPLKVSVAGIDADLAEFNNLIFDANQPPYRLWGTGYQSLIGISYNDYIGGQNTREGTPVLVAASPSGTVPIFLLAPIVGGGGGIQWPGFPYRNNAGTSGGGGAICRNSGNNYFIPVTFGNIGPPGTPTIPGAGAYVNYTVFKNYT